MPEYSRQYIGARYVPKLFVGENGGMEWQENTSYENFTMVSYRNDYYISRKDVPSSIGNPYDYRTFWCRMGTMNGGIANLQTQINNLKDEIADEIEDILYVLKGYFVGKKYLIISDSYGVGYSPDGNTKSFAYSIKDFLSYYGASCVVSARSDATWNGATTYYSLYEKVINQGPFTDILIVGGYNQESSFGQQVLDFENAVRRVNKCAISYLDVGCKATSYEHNYNEAKYYAQSINSLNGGNINHCVNSRYILNRKECFSSDNIHPSQVGQNLLYNNIVEFLINGHIDVFHVENNFKIENSKITLYLPKTINVNKGVNINSSIRIVDPENWIYAIGNTQPLILYHQFNQNNLNLCVPWVMNNDGSISIYCMDLPSGATTLRSVSSHFSKTEFTGYLA